MSICYKRYLNFIVFEEVKRFCGALHNVVKSFDRVIKSAVKWIFQYSEIKQRPLKLIAQK